MNIDKDASLPNEKTGIAEYDGRYGENPPDTVPGINTPGIELPEFNPPVPNRAWTAMRQGLDIDALSEEEKRDLYIGNDNIL